MKAAIVEANGAFAVALAQDGRFLRLVNKQYEVGQTVAIRERKPLSRGKLAAFVSVAAVLLLFFGGGFTAYATPYGIVSLDVNPSIEYTINVFDRVLGVRAVNKDAEPVLGQIDSDELLNQPIEDAIDVTIEQLQQNGYFAEVDDNYIMLSANAVNAAHAERLAITLKTCVNAHANLVVESVAVSTGEVEQAHHMGTSAGKMYLVERLKNASNDPTGFDENEWIDEPIRDIIRAYETLNKNKNNADEGTPYTESGNACTDSPDLPGGLSPSDSSSSDGKQEGESQGNSSGNMGKPRKAMAMDHLKRTKS